MSLYITDENGELHKIAGAGGGAGSTIDVDSELNADSTNPVQNKTLYNPVTFAEAERQKSKNILKFPYEFVSKTENGITFTALSDGSISINGAIIDNNSNGYAYIHRNFSLEAGTYTFSLDATNNNIGALMVFYDGQYYKNVGNKPYTITYNSAVNINLYVQVAKDNINTFNNVIVKPMIVKGTEVGEWQPYNGAIVHEKDIEDVERIETIYDMSSADSNINKGYTSGIVSNASAYIAGFSNLRMSKKIKIYYRFWEFLLMSEMDMTNPISASEQQTLLQVLPQNESSNAQYCGVVQIVDNSSIKFKKVIKVTDGSTISNVTGDSNFIITKIERID